jgi:hypothetical protein
MAFLCRAVGLGVKYWEIIADRLSKAGWSWGCIATFDSEGRTIWIADAHRVTISAGNSQTECSFWLSKRLAEVGITIRKNGSILGLSSNPTKKVSSK